MATSNRRVAAYLPTEIDEAFKAFKIKNGFSTEDEPNSNDSKALIEIVRQFLNVEYQVAHLVSLPDSLVTQSQLDEFREEILDKLSELRSELISSSLSELLPFEKEQIIKQEEVQDKSPKPESFEEYKPLSTPGLAKRLDVPRSTLQGRKSKTTSEELFVWTQEKDPEDIGWVWDSSVKKFRAASKSGGSLSVSQGELID